MTKVILNFIPFDAEYKVLYKTFSGLFQLTIIFLTFQGFKFFDWFLIRFCNLYFKLSYDIYSYSFWTKSILFWTKSFSFLDIVNFIFRTNHFYLRQSLFHFKRAPFLFQMYSPPFSESIRTSRGKFSDTWKNKIRTLEKKSDSGGIRLHIGST